MLRQRNGGAQRWRYALATSTGSSHLVTGDPCQDACACEVLLDDDDDEVLVAVASDGAGSAPLSHLGSRTVCRSIVESVRRHLASRLRVGALTEGRAREMIASARGDLDAAAEEAGVPSRDLACTLVAAVVATDLAVFFQVGDGAVVAAPLDEVERYELIFWPDRGEYANTTSFLTSRDVDAHILYAVVPGAVEDIAVLTDGLQSLVLDLRTRQAHAPFFTAMFSPLRSPPVTQVGRQDALCEALERYLDSRMVCARTDDDKTLVLASRR